MIGNSSLKTDRTLFFLGQSCTGGAHGVMVIVVGNGHSGTSSNPGRD